MEDPPVPPPTAPTQQPGRLARLGDFAFRRRRLVVIGWIAALVVAFAASSQLSGEYNADYSTPGSESKAAEQRLADRFPQQTPFTVDVVWQAKDASSPAATERIDTLLADAQKLPGIGDGVTARDAEVSRDGTIAVARVPLSVSNVDEVPDATGEKLLALGQAANRDGVRVELGGQPVQQAQQGEVSSEMVGLAIAAIVLLLTFGTLVAAGLPLATALFGLGISSAIGGILAAVIDTPDWSTSVAAMIGIGVGIDYALLIVTRYRGALAAGREPRAAVVESIAAAGRSVLIAGTTVVISLLGLFLMGLPYLYGAALATILAVIVVMAASVTLVPALMAMAGPRIERLRIPGVNRTGGDPDRTLAARWSRAVQRRPLVAAVAGVLVLLVLASPFAGLRLGFPDRGNDAADTTTRQAYDLVSQGFGPGANGPLLLAAQTADAGERAAMQALAGELRDEPGVAAVSQPAASEDGAATMLSVTPRTSPQDAATEDLIEHLRADVLPGAGVDVKVGGATAAFMDQSQATADRLPLFIGGVVGLSFLLLLLSFRSVVMSIKAAAMNLLSIGAAYGVVAYLAEGGWAGR